jgi:hypothetical protein
LAQSSVDEKCGFERSTNSALKFDSSAAATFSDKVSAGNKWRLNKKTPLASVRPHQNLNRAVDIYSSRMCNNIDEIRGGNASVFLFFIRREFCCCAGIEFQTAHTSVNDEHLLAALKTCRHVSTALQ